MKAVHRQLSFQYFLLVDLCLMTLAGIASGRYCLNALRMNLPAHLCDFILNVIIMGSFSAVCLSDLIRKIQIPHIKPHLIIPLCRIRRLKIILPAILIDAGSLSISFMLWGLAIGMYLTVRNVSGLVLSIAAAMQSLTAIKVNVWSLKMSLTFLKEAGFTLFYVAISISAFLSFIFLLQYPAMSFILSGAWLILSVSLLYRNSEILVNYIYDLKQNNQGYMPLYAGNSTKYPFLTKELRLIMRSRRLKYQFMLLAFASLLVIAAAMGQNFNLRKDPFLYIGLTAVLIFADYYERFWAWDRNSYGLIFSIPSAREGYFMQKLLAGMIPLLPFLLFHLILYHHKMLSGILTGLASAMTILVAAGRGSMTKENLNADPDLNMGKTTLLSLLCTLRRPDTGDIFFNEIRLTRDNLNWWKGNFGVYLDESFMFGYYTVREHFRLIADAWKIDETVFKERMERYLELFKLREHIDKRISGLSFGNRKKTGLMASLLPAAKCIIWDEPFSGLDPGGQEKLKEILSGCNQKNNTKFIISSHDIHHITEISRDMIILEEGRIKMRLKDDISYSRIIGSLIN